MAIQPAVERLVEVAIDAAGAGGARTYTYAVPDSLAGLEAGEAVLVEYGRRQALGVVMGEAAGRPGAGVRMKPVLERVRADGPLLPALSLDLARWISGHYLAPAAFVLRAMLPPGMLERLELVAEVRPDRLPGADEDQLGDDDSGSFSAEDRDLLQQLLAGPRAARDFAVPEGRAGLLRRLRSLAVGASSISTGRSPPRRPGRATSAGRSRPSRAGRPRQRWPVLDGSKAARSGRARLPCSRSWPRLPQGSPERS